MIKGSGFESDGGGYGDSLYDPWWNSVVENQATDRAWRIEQDKRVFVDKLVTEKTVEEKIVSLQAAKQTLMAGIYGEAATAGPAAKPRGITGLVAGGDII